MSLVETELREAPDAVARQASALNGPVRDLVARLSRRPPAVVVTCARGSSAHAATFGKHLIERYRGIPVAAAAPVVATADRRDLQLDGQLFLAISQSGRSDDLIETAASAKRAGALTAALVNDAESPLAAACDIVLPIGAGPERAVAATKSFVASLSALLRLVALWADDGAMRGAIDRLPERLAQAVRLDWGKAAEAFAGARSLVAIGRGPTLAIAREAALKFKEVVADLHAEAFSGAEFLHGPVALVAPDYPLLMFVAPDETANGMRRLAVDLRGKGAELFRADPGCDIRANLATLAPDHPDADALCLIQSFYRMVAEIAERRGIDADRPRHLQKITRTR